MRQRTPRLAAAAATIVILGLVAGCSSSGAANPAPQGDLRYGSAPAVGQAGSATGGQGGGADTALKSSGGAGGQDQVVAQAPTDGAKIVRTGTMELQVADLQAALTAARTKVAALGGYIGAEKSAAGSDQPVASITYRIPVARWDEAIDSLHGLALNVVAEDSQAIEVTSQLVDLGARIRNLQASETALQAIAASATRISDVLDVQARLSDVRGQIEQLTAQQASLQDQVAYGTMTVTYGLQVAAVSEAARNWNPGAQVDGATASLVGILQALASAGIWFGIVWLPIIAVLLVLAVGLGRLGRRLGLRLPRNPEPTPPSAPLAPEA